MKDWGALPPYRKISETLKALRDPLYFLRSPYFLGPSLAHIMTDKKAELVKEFYEGKYVELDLLGGMRGGKSSLIIGLGAYETFQVLQIDYVVKYNLAPGSPLFGVFLSAKEETAFDTLYQPFIAYLEQSPYFLDQISDSTKKMITFPERGFTVKPIASSAATESGRTCKFVGIDELGKIQQTESLRGAREIYRSITKSTETLQSDGHRLIAGSIVTANDLLIELVRDNSLVKTCLTKVYPTWVLNPQITRESLEDEFQKDPIGAARDYGCEIYAAEDVFFRDPGIINFDTNRQNILLKIAENLPITVDKRFRYSLAGDPSLRHCAFGIALSHREGDTYITDGVYRFVPTATKKDIDPLEVKDFFIRVVKEVPVGWVVFDTWQYPETVAEIRKAGVPVLNHVVKQEDYLFYKNLCYEKKQECVSYSPVESEFKGLIVKATKIDHPRVGSKDCSDAVVNSVWVLKTKTSTRPGLEFVKRI